VNRTRTLLNRPSALVDGVDKIGDVMRAAGLVDVQRRITAASQTASGRRPGPQA
jgi:hypothetical protein